MRYKIIEHGSNLIRARLKTMFAYKVDSLNLFTYRILWYNILISV
jgi:hypothetical protein